MSTDALFAVTRFGLDYERMRMEAASRHIATADLPIAQRAAALKGAQAQGFSEALGEVASLADQEQPGKVDNTGEHEVMDPNNPMAGANGMVHYPNIDLAQEMTTLMSAQRAYQADVRAFNTLHGMMLKSLEIGGH
ncbi:flagellar basal body rod protein FlgC [Dyella silvatica]|uniref:flagellar basal body rod protein FlgC n=1 Tax=Dyella silvatica TaxID=2992128 RepID=UPI00224D3397|nr:flagellar basal body rod C-terminal domain-containing protein [Dyella silvatica]